MLAPKGPRFNGRPTFANPVYLKKAQSENPCLYEIPYDTFDLANRYVLDREETLTLEKESRSKLNKNLVKPYDYTKQNSIYEYFNPASQEYHDQLAHANEYVESLEKEINELESDKADFSNMYDLLLQECVPNDVMCSYFHSLSDLDAHTKLQCMYQHKIQECECLAEKLSKQTETVSKEVYNELLRICNETKSAVFIKEREQYFEIQDLKAQLQDKNIAISELKKLIKKIKGEGVDTNFEKKSILGKPPLQPIRNQPVVRQPNAYKSERSQFPRHRKLSFAKPYDVNAPGPYRNSLKHVSFQSPRESVGSNYMVHNYYLEEAKKKAQLQKDKALNTKPSVKQSARLPNTTNGNKPKPRNFNQQPRNWPPSMSSRVSNRTVNIAEPSRNQKPFLKSKDLACPTCKKGSKTLSWKPYQGDSLNLPDHRYKRRCCSLIPAESDSLPHAHAQATKTYIWHRDSKIKKAQKHHEEIHDMDRQSMHLASILQHPCEMIEDCCCWLVDELLDRSASRSIVVDEGEPAMSTALSAIATGTGETTLYEGLKYSSNIC
ncbi:hypothetical protein Tco_0051250 [Tanacetum coccineum]